MPLHLHRQRRAHHPGAAAGQDGGGPPGGLRLDGESADREELPRAHRHQGGRLGAGQDDDRRRRADGADPRLRARGRREVAAEIGGEDHAQARLEGRPRPARRGRAAGRRRRDPRGPRGARGPAQVLQRPALRERRAVRRGHGFGVDFHGWLDSVHRGHQPRARRRRRRGRLEGRLEGGGEGGEEGLSCETTTAAQAHRHRPARQRHGGVFARSHGPRPVAPGEADWRGEDFAGWT
mmetsp:Transcript_10725/g.35654  ORF Transcript_10725/g.35654 Transcript_10725/m.35654 type:complete len:236 (-) Transcript_10725:830-1537(-)